MRAEVQSGSERGKHLNELMQKGILVSNQLVLDMIKDAMLSKIKTSKGFLIDGYPRQVDQGIEFEKQVFYLNYEKIFNKKFIISFKKKIAPCKLCLYIDASDESMKKRLLHRGQSSGRVDDNEETIKQRLKTFHDVTSPVIDYYGKQNKLRKVDSERNPDMVFADVEKILDTFDQGFSKNFSIFNQ